MKDTGLPSPFMLIMMLSPALRTSHSAFCAPASVICTTLPGSPRSPISATRSPSARAGASRGLADELDQQDRFGLADQRALDDRPERGIAAREVDHRPVDQLDRRRPEADDVLRGIHRPVQRRKVDDAEHAVPRQRREVQRERARPGERALAADEQMREVDAAVRGVGPLALRAEEVDVVAADAPHHLRHLPLDLVALARTERLQPFQQARERAATPRSISRSGPNRASVPSASVASMASTLCTMLP